MLVRLCAVFAVLVLPATASATGIEGTENEPELVDAPDDVAYHAADVARESDYLDILGFWIDYDNQTDMVGLHWKAADTSPLKNAIDGSAIHCQGRLNLTAGDDVLGTLYPVWDNTNTKGTLSTSLTYIPNRDNVATEAGIDVPFSFEGVFAAPGYLTWNVERARLQNLGESIGQLDLNCREGKGPRVPGAFVSPIYYNGDAARSMGMFALDGLRPASGNGSDENGETGESTGATLPSAEQTGTTAGVGFVGVVLVISALGLARRRPR